MIQLFAQNQKILVLGIGLELILLFLSLQPVYAQNCRDVDGVCMSARECIQTGAQCDYSLGCPSDNPCCCRSPGLSSYQAGGRTIYYRGFVPCGKSEETLAVGESIEVTYPCQLCHIFVMIDRIFDFILGWLVPGIATIMFIVGGLMFFFAGGDPGKIETAKRVLTTTVIGIAVIFGAFLIVGTIFRAIGVAEWTGFGEWYEKGLFRINCPIRL